MTSFGSRQCLCTFYMALYISVKTNKPQLTYIRSMISEDGAMWTTGAIWLYYVYCKIVLTIAIAMRTATGFVGWYWHICLSMSLVLWWNMKHTKIYPMLSGNDDVVQEIGGAKFPTMSEMVAYTIDKYWQESEEGIIVMWMTRANNNDSPQGWRKHEATGAVVPIKCSGRSLQIQVYRWRSSLIYINHPRLNWSSNLCTCSSWLCWHFKTQKNLKNGPRCYKRASWQQKIVLNFFFFLCTLNMYRPLNLMTCCMGLGVQRYCTPPCFSPLHLSSLTLPLIHGHQSGACSLLVFTGCTSL